MWAVLRVLLFKGIAAGGGKTPEAFVGRRCLFGVGLTGVLWGLYLGEGLPVGKF